MTWIFFFQNTEQTHIYRTKKITLEKQINLQNKNKEHRTKNIAIFIFKTPNKVPP